jgi:ABC-type spermidine/putrescine transport system permease subunit I
VETVIVHVLHLEDIVVIGIIMLIVTLVLTALRNLALGSSERRMTIARAIGHLLVLLVLSYAILAAVWWYDARVLNSWFDASRRLISQVSAAIDPRGQLELVLRTLGLARHLIVACLMLALALAWETVKWTIRGIRAPRAQATPSQ